MTFQEVYMDTIEFLYNYREFQILFNLHLLVVGLLGTYIFYLLCIRCKLTALQSDPKTQPSKCHDHMRYVDYLNEKKRTTQSQVQKLQNSKQYQRFMMQKADPNSRYNRQIQVEQIVFSDEQNEMEKARTERKNKTM